MRFEVVSFKANCPLVGPGPIGGVSSVGGLSKGFEVVGFKANCPLVGPGPIGGVPSVGVFLRDPSLYLREFRRKPRKTPNG